MCAGECIWRGVSYCGNKGGDVVEDRCVFESNCNCVHFVESLNGGPHMHVQTSVCMCEQVCVCDR